jgi:hypothetical protein
MYGDRPSNVPVTSHRIMPVASHSDYGCITLCVSDSSLHCRPLRTIPARPSAAQPSTVRTLLPVACRMRACG